MRILGIDVDEVLADLHNPWKQWILDSFGYSIEFTQWDIDKLLPEWVGGQVFDFLRPRIYEVDTVLPIPGALDALNALRYMGNEIHFVTACANGTTQAKLDWLKRHNFFQEGDTYRPGRDKHNSEADILVDDGFHNCIKFPRLAYLVTRPHNINKFYPLRISDLWELTTVI